ncbi:hypothetical protein SAMN02745164_02174 [Marinitoga hydrogenitolerans DSM 16785]|uniref:Uncharacterized protein n=1 Tax=Marinitoga hydrogenitolerans (strain DSM 16785 / JCM 12826 / AT1271) TaxID=1122195 RepID=A0A1M5AEN9_MARH1|nr:hypothetical protein [Marinitoga hydrogenitolerans]SHF28770.1 hypothetical protein SAMN02745164_02174 [Marinitoga hydrogenitolerans DSM 16785]
MVTTIYYNKKFLYRFKNKGFGNIKVNITDYYGIIKNFQTEKEMNKYIIKNSRNFDISTKKLKYIELKNNIYYLYITNYIKKFKQSLFYDYTIPLNYLLWTYLEKNSYNTEYITFTGENNNIIFQKIEESYIYGVYSNKIMGDEINFNENLLIKIIKNIKGDFKNAIYV